MKTRTANDTDAPPRDNKRTLVSIQNDTKLDNDASNALWKEVSMREEGKTEDKSAAKVRKLHVGRKKGLGTLLK